MFNTRGYYTKPFKLYQILKGRERVKEKEWGGEGIEKRGKPERGNYLISRDISERLENGEEIKRKMWKRGKYKNEKGRIAYKIRM